MQIGLERNIIKNDKINFKNKYKKYDKEKNKKK